MGCMCGGCIGAVCAGIPGCGLAICGIIAGLACPAGVGAGYAVGALTGFGSGCFIVFIQFYVRT